MVQKLKLSYNLWLQCVPHIPKTHRYTFGGKVDAIFLEALEYIFRAQYTKSEQKIAYLTATVGKVDIIKFFLQLGWENKLIDHKKYSTLSMELNETGRMLGGWKKGLETKLPPK